MIHHRGEKDRYTLAVEYRLIKLLQREMELVLADLHKQQEIDKFVSIASAIEKIRSELFQQYETREAVSARARQLK